MALPEKTDKTSNTRLFRDLDKDTKPLMPLPEDSLEDVKYNQFHQQKCVICNSPWRDRAEHVYLESGRKVMPVLYFFSTYFDARLNYTQVATHMQHHCGFQSVASSGLKNYEDREQELSAWRFREDSLVLTALMVELDDIRGMDCSKSNDLKLKRAQVVERLVSKILDVKSRRDEAAMNAVNIFEILSEIHDSLENEADKRKVRDKVKEIRLRLTQPNAD